MALSFLPESLRRQLEAFDPSATPQDSEAIPLSESERVEELLAGLEFATAPTQPRVGKTRNILGNIAGGLGDALIAAGNIRAGGQSRGRGPFREERLARDQGRRVQAIRADAANRDLRNRVRIGAANSEAAERRAEIGAKGEVEEARIRARADIKQEEILAASKLKKQKLEIDSKFHGKLMDELIDRGISTSGIDITTPVSEIQKRLDAHDPDAKSRAMVSTLIEMGLGLESATVSKDGSLSVRVAKPKNPQHALAESMIGSGQDPRPFMPDATPEQRDLAFKASVVEDRRRRNEDADATLADVVQHSRENQFNKFNEFDKSTTALGPAAAILLSMGNKNATDAEVKAFFMEKVTMLARVLEEQEAKGDEDLTPAEIEKLWTEVEANEFITELTNLIRMRFGFDPRIDEDKQEEDSELFSGGRLSGSGAGAGF